MKQTPLTQRPFPIYRPWDPARAQLVQSSQLPCDLAIQLKDHAHTTPPRVISCSNHGQSTIIRRDQSAQTPLDVEALVELILQLQAQSYNHQAQHRSLGFRPLPFVCHLYAAPDPLSPAWLATTLRLLQATRPFNVEWSIFIDGRFWDDDNPKTSQLVQAINENRLNVILYVDRFRTDSKSVHYRSLGHDNLMMNRRSLLYSLANTNGKSRKTNICAAINPTYQNSSTIIQIFQEAVEAGAHPFIGCLDAYHHCRDYYQHNLSSNCPQHYRSYPFTGDDLIPTIDRINEWCYHQQKPYAFYQAPVFSHPVLRVDELNHLFIDPHLNMAHTFATDVKPEPLGKFSGSDALSAADVSQLFSQQIAQQP